MNGTPPANSQAAECFRLALPLMAKHNIELTPKNYTVWFEYVSDREGEVHQAIDQMLAEGIEFNEQTNAMLYDRYVASSSVKHLAKLRGEMADILSEVKDSMTSASNETHRFGGRLNHISNEFTRCRSLDEIRTLMQDLVSETRRMRATTEDLKEHFEQKNLEVENLKHELEIEKRKTNTDPLTGLANRRAFFDSLADLLHNADKQAISLITFDIDHFKKINDTHGHLVGDRVIRFVAETLIKNCKGRDLACRIGGEEFIILLPFTALEGGRNLAEQVRVQISQSKLVRSDTKIDIGEITLSAGVSQYQSGEEMMAFVERADQALYAAKNSGRNKTCTENQLGPTLKSVG